jgi:predicted site-specific integrase-resolvase
VRVLDITRNLDTAQAAQLLGRSENTIRQWVHRGYLTPVDPRQRSHTFRIDDLWQCSRDRRPASGRARDREAWQLICAMS